jgi:hypothetical protein
VPPESTDKWYSKLLNALLGTKTGEFHDRPPSVLFTTAKALPPLVGKST